MAGGYKRQIARSDGEAVVVSPSKNKRRKASHREGSEGQDRDTPV